uniref:S8 family serine peptidase n=1 Tax=Cellvibrio fontiphilus TaxID=1815559 RepID=UPI002B4C0CD4|nr:S8 family serine peptidase [Cellvibrio fontiphilus]
MGIRMVAFGLLGLITIAQAEASGSPVADSGLQAAVTGEITQRKITVSQDQSRTGSTLPPVVQEFELQHQSALALTKNASGIQTQVVASSQPQRFLVRLKDQPLNPYLKQQRRQLAATGKLSRAQQQQLAKSVVSYRQQLQKRQADTLAELRKQKLVSQVHRQFTQLTNTLNVTATGDQIKRIRRLPQVAAVYPDHKVTANLAESVPLTEAPQLWAMNDALGFPLTGRGVTVAILDTGIDYTHPDLGGCIGAGCKVAGGHNFIEWEDPTNPMDIHGHGTHVAGIVAAKGALTGMAPDVSLYAYKVLTDNGWGNNSSIIAALEKAVDPDGDPLTDDQIDIVNMSLGGPGAPDSPLSEAANNAAQAGVLVVVAAGNSGSNYSTIDSPGNAELALTVGASDNYGAIADFSSRGPIVGKQYVKPEIVAPGVNINSTKPGGSYVRLSGTSMATPHVAGGAALLKQRFPELSANDIKTLLINHTSDLGQNVFTQGAGLMKLLAAVNAKVLIQPRLLNAGSVNLAEQSWTPQLPVSVKNISASPVTVAFRAPATYPTGASASVTPAEPQVLAAGQEQSFNLQLIVDPQTLPYADNATLHHEITATLEVDSQPVLMPLVFAKSARLNLDFVGAPWVLHIFNDTGSYFAFDSFSDCSEPPSNYGVDVKPGTYKLHVAFYNSDCSVSAMVFKENIEVSGDARVLLDINTAVNQISIGRIKDEQGAEMNLDGMRAFDKTLIWFIPEASISGLFFLGSSGKDIMRVSPTSDKFKLQVSTMFSLPDTRPGTPGRYFLLDEVFPEGVNNSHFLDLDMAAAGGVNFRYEDADVLANGVTFGVGSTMIKSLLGLWGASSFQVGSEVYYEPIEAKVHTNLAKLDEGEWYPEFGVYHYNPDPTVWSRELMRTGPMAMTDITGFTKLEGAFSVVDETNYRSDSSDLVISDSAYFLAAEYRYDAAGKQLSVRNVSKSDGSSFTIQRDHQENNFFDAMPYRQYCDGQLINQAEVNGSNFTLLFTDPNGVANCDADLALEFDQPTRLLGRLGQSTSRLEIDVAAIKAMGDVTVYGPELHMLEFRSDGRATRVLNGNDLEVLLRATAGSSAGLDMQAGQILVEYRLDGDADWIVLPLTQTANDYSAKLPVMAGTRAGSLRISLRNTLGISQINTLNGVFWLGTDGKAQGLQPPVINPLPPLIFEATGRETSVDLPAVVATDPIDGQIPAVASNLGPFALGEHNIYWQATNSIGKKTRVVQRLSILDTTPPQVIAPADLQVTATGDITQVTLGSARAVDLVDGEVGAWTDHSGVFAPGVHQVGWHAFDSRSNMGSAFQRVTVVAQSSAASSIASSSAASSRAATGGGSGGGSGGASSGGGGGGSSSTLILFMLLVMAIGAGRAGFLQPIKQ